MDNKASLSSLEEEHEGTGCVAEVLDGGSWSLLVRGTWIR